MELLLLMKNTQSLLCKAKKPSDPYRRGKLVATFMFEMSFEGINSCLYLYLLVFNKAFKRI